MAVTALTVTLAASGQQDGSQLPLATTTAGTFRSTIDLVTLNVAVTDRKDRPVVGLGRDDFQVFEDGVAQDVSYFAATEVPLDVALLVDSSSSMQSKMAMVEQAAEGFIRILRPVDRVAVMGFATQLKVLQPFTDDHTALLSAIRRITPRGSTALYTSLYVALDNFQKARRDQAAAGGTVRRPAIVVLTDGEDTASLLQFDDLLDRARRTGIAIYPISIVGSFDPTGLGDVDRRFSNLSDFSLKTLAQETGARAFFPSQLADLAGIYRTVADELSMQYALGYVPRVERRDGSYRRLSVRILTHPDARPRTRTGYFSAGPVRAANAR